MKKLLCLFCMILLLSACQNNTSQQQYITITASFYPVYLLAENITDGVEGILLQNMAQPQTGCLHDYQLTTKDRKTLEKTDLLLINGAGMESFLNAVINQYDDFNIVDTSQNTLLLSSEHHHQHPEHEEEEYNGHIWLSSENALKQAENICAALCQKDKKHQQQYLQNLENLRQKIKSFQSEIQSEQKSLNKTKVIIFHEGFHYIAEEYGFEIAGEILTEQEKTPSAKELAEMIDKIKNENITVFFAADDEGKKYAELLARETGANIFLLNTITNGPLQKEAFFDAIQQNRTTIQEALNL